ncbi:serine/threonine-protein kinase [Amycolatopsis umgeniensis]|uniref:non-specific serine/threonine protein kinase n=1 Tax=Amycolatopsis umgeniensis TaxID=336628 RepID=A0A841AWT6_9PSEU|nr:serine/threonine-protein kinase [Amycolatopsis umgeniensis]MBB5850588.1 serine/threonine-protein kinase [Amycolatopsis umgeniensis]
MSAPAEVVAALPQYEIGAAIGQGGMGVVFAGVHRSLGRDVAIKQLPWDVLNHAVSSQLFDREARVLASLDHPHIVPVYDYVRTGREHLMVMERLDGGTVHSRFQAGGVGAEQACAIGLAMLAGLHAAHEAGVLHLDVKPKNLLFTTQGVMKVADFGIAKVISEGATLVTHGGEVLGTPAYIAPEQAMGNALSPAADVYSAGTVLYELLSGKLPFDNTRGAISMMRQHMFTDPRPIDGVPAPLAMVIMRSLARELDSRYRDAETFAADLASAATAVYGPGWLERSRVPVRHLTPRVISALSTPVAVPVPAGDGPTRPVHRPTPDPTLSATRAAFEPEPFEPQTAEPSSPVLWFRLAAAAAALALVVLALLNPERQPHEPSLLAVDLAVVSSSPEVDFSKTFTLTGKGNPGQVSLDLTAAGIPLGSATATPKFEGDSYSADLRFPGLTRWIVGGAVTATVTAGGVTETFTLRTHQHPLASALGAGSLILALFALAYLESGLRTLRNGHRWRGALVGGPILGLLFGAAAWLCVSVLRVREPAVLSGVGCAIAGAVAAGFVVAAARARRTR